MYVYKFSNQNWMVFRHKTKRKPFWVVKSWFTMKNLEICVSVIFSRVIYWGSLISGSRNSLQSCAWPSIPDKNSPWFKSWWIPHLALHWHHPSYPEICQNEISNNAAWCSHCIAICGNLPTTHWPNFGSYMI